MDFITRWFDQLTNILPHKYIVGIRILFVAFWFYLAYYAVQDSWQKGSDEAARENKTSGPPLTIKEALIHEQNLNKMPNVELPLIESLESPQETLRDVENLPLQPKATVTRKTDIPYIGESTQEYLKKNTSKYYLPNSNALAKENSRLTLLPIDENKELTADPSALNRQKSQDSTVQMITNENQKTLIDNRQENRETINKLVPNKNRESLEKKLEPTKKPIPSQNNIEDDISPLPLPTL